MAKTGIGFGQAPDKTETWERMTDGRVFEFTKRCESENVFVYNCKFRGKNGERSTGLHLERDLNRDEVEALPQFREFVAQRS
jgi:hypothetical protein